MLTKANRLTKKKDFENIFKKGRSFKQDSLIFKIIENHLDRTRFGFIVSQKVSKKATLRNRIRRKISESVRLKIQRLRKGIDGVLIALPKIAGKSFLDINETIEKLFKKAKIL